MAGLPVDEGTIKNLVSLIAERTHQKQKQFIYVKYHSRDF